MKVRDILYVLATPNFFSEGPCGRVSHATGFVKGLLENGKTVTVLTGPGMDKFIAADKRLRLKEFWRGGAVFFEWVRFFFHLIFNVNNYSRVVVRWRPMLPLFFILVKVVKKDIWFEVNSITGIDSASWVVRAGVSLSTRITVRFFNVIVVSEHSKKELEAISGVASRCYVMPNGFITSPLDTYKHREVVGAKPTMVYFGRKQSYYDWDLFYKLSKELLDEGLIGGVVVFGFEDVVPWIDFRGEFDHDSLVHAISDIASPLLVLHPDGSTTARSGSPMKLFEYAALGLPVVLGDAVQAQAEAFSCFVKYKSGDKQSFYEALAYAAENYERLAITTISARRIALENYSWKAVVHTWVESLSKR